MTRFNIDKERLSASGINVKNIVAKQNIEIELDLDYLSSELPNSSFEPENYPSLIFRPVGLSTVLITRTGVLLFTGADSVANLQETYECVTSELENLEIESEKSIDDIEIVNIVTTFSVDSKLNLSHLCVRLGFENTEYEPEVFPGVIYRIDGGPVVLIFSSGNVVITGAISTKEILDAKNQIKKLIMD